MNKLLRFILVPIWAVLMAAVLGAILFISAGRWDLPRLWVYCGIYAALIFASGLSIDLGLFEERLRPGPGGRDRWAVVPMKLLAWAHLITAGLDVGRYHWTDTIPLGIQVVALIGFGLGFGLAVWSMAVNRFFSSVVRIQEERGHHLVTTGPYGYIRHPGYAGIAAGLLCSPLALGSWTSAVPIVVFLLLLTRRIVLEDRFLHENLRGYDGYAETVRYRLVPGIW